MTTMGKLGAVVMVGLALALGARTSSTAPNQSPARLVATTLVLRAASNDDVHRLGSEAARLAINDDGKTVSRTSCATKACPMASLSRAVGSKSMQSSPTGHLVLRWSRKLTEPIAVSDGVVLSRCGTGCVAADHVTSGARLWTFVDHENSDIWGIAAADGVVLVAAGHLRPNSCGPCLQYSQVYRIDALDEASGRLVWTLPISPGKTSQPVQWLPAVIAGEVAVVQLTDGVALGVGLRSGRVLWRSGRLASYCDPQPPAGAVPDVVLVGCSGQVEAFDPATGHIIWIAAAKSASGSEGGAVEVANGESSGVVAVELGFGSFPVGAPSMKSTFAQQDSSWDMTSVVILSATTGRSRWTLTDAAQGPVVFGGGGSVCVQGFAGVECRSAITGRLRWSLATPYVSPGSFALAPPDPIETSGSVTYAITPGAGKGSSVTGRAWLLESLNTASGTRIGSSTHLPKVPPDPGGTPTPPAVAAIGDGIVLVSVGSGAAQSTYAYGR